MHHRKRKFSGVSRSGKRKLRKISRNKLTRKNKKVLRLRGGSGGRKNITGGGTFVGKHGKRVHKEAIGKNVKVSKLFKKKVEKVTAGERPYGYYQESYTGEIKHFINHRQRVQMVPDLQSGGTGSESVTIRPQEGTTLLGNNYSRSAGSPSLIDPCRILNAASILWYNKTPTYTCDITDTNNFDWKTFQIEVKKVWAVVNFRNNTQRGQNLKLMLCSPNQVLKVTSPNPGQDWVNADQSYVDPGADNQTATLAINQGTDTNFNSNGHTMLGYDPKHLPDWKKIWSRDVTTYYLAPGEQVTYKVDLMRNKYLRYSKFVYPDSTTAGGSTNLNGQKFNKYLMCVMYPDLGASDYIGTTNPGGVGRCIDQSTVDMRNGMLYEVNLHYELALPELAGFSTPASFSGNTSYQLHGRHDAFAIQYFPNDQQGTQHYSAAVSGGTGGMQLVESMNPQSEAVPGV